jgi:hypothetical protein
MEKSPSRVGMEPTSLGGVPSHPILLALCNMHVAEDGNRNVLAATSVCSNMSHVVVQVHVMDRCTLLLAWLTTDTDASAHPSCMPGCMHRRLWPADHRASSGHRLHRSMDRSVRPRRTGGRSQSAGETTPASARAPTRPTNQPRPSTRTWHGRARGVLPAPRETYSAIMPRYHGAGGSKGRDVRRAWIPPGRYSTCVTAHTHLRGASRQLHDRSSCYSYSCVLAT